jgi:hypothetical protein
MINEIEVKTNVLPRYIPQIDTSSRTYTDPLQVFLFWLDCLPKEEQVRMLDDFKAPVETGDVAKFKELLAGWGATAELYSDPQRLAEVEKFKRDYYRLQGWEEGGE